jgi:hypothetical protein
MAPQWQLQELSQPRLCTRENGNPPAVLIAEIVSVCGGPRGGGWGCNAMLGMSLCKPQADMSSYILAAEPL